jgi:hypothetical protein
MTYRELDPKNAPPYSMLFGSIPGIVETLKALPQDCHPHSYFTEYSRKYSLGPVFLLDNWPAVSYRQMVITDPVSWIPNIAMLCSVPTRNFSSFGRYRFLRS